MSRSNSSTNHALASALAVTPTAIGGAVGVLVGRTLRPKHGNLTALVLLGIGVAAAVPALVDVISRRLNAPETPRGLRRLEEAVRSGDIPENSDLLNPDDTEFSH